MTTTREAAALARSQNVRALADRPSQRRSLAADDAPRGAVRCTVLAPTHSRSEDGSEQTHVGGVASVVEQGYEMYDMFGTYTEVISRDAFHKTLADGPLVEFTLNHARNGGAPMAHTRNGTLTLKSTEAGLEYDAVVDPTRSDVADVLKALTRGDLAEASFKFSIVRGSWSPDYQTYRIEEVDLNRGDVSAVNFGANPAATSGMRAEQQPVEAPAPKTRARVYDDELQDRIA